MIEESNIVNIPDEFKYIAPYAEHEFKAKLERLVHEPGFEHAIRYVIPNVDYDAFVKGLLTVETMHDFQVKVAAQFLEVLEKHTTDGIRIFGTDNCNKDINYTFITNHRDIVLDACFLNLGFIRNDMPITQVAIGNNLLIYDWITDLVKINRSFIVKRDVKMIQALEAAKQLSAYIHYTIQQCHESIWIAQREGRAKDSNDLTQESLIKMLSLAGEGSVKENLMAINLCPVAISYEYDPNDYLKAKEFLMKRRDPSFKKSQHDDLYSMEVGILKYKGHVTFRVGKCINDGLKSFASDERMLVIKEACRLIDKSIHSGYEIYPGNYIAYDQLYATDKFTNEYTEADVVKFNEYISSQLSKADVADVSEEEMKYMREMMLTMYANPLKNKMAAMQQPD